MADRLSMGVYKHIKPNQFICHCTLQNSFPPWPNDLTPSYPMRPYTHEDLRLCQEERLNGGRLIYTVIKNAIVIKVIKITSDHDYT